MTVYQRGKPLRNWLISSDDAARAIHVTPRMLQALTTEGYIKPGLRKGFYRLGSVIDGYSEAVRMGRLPAPHERSEAPAVLACAV